MTQARRTLVRRTAVTMLPVALLALTATAGVLTQPQTESVRTTPVSFANGNPVGKLKTTKVPGGLRLRGWTIDPSKQRTQLRVVATVSGRATKAAVANRSVTLSRTYRKAGRKHGFDFVVPVREGVRTVCVVAKDVGRGRDASLGCLRRATFDYGPFGRLETAGTQPGHLAVKGWLVDADRPTAAVTTRVTIDGVAHDLVANGRRDDVARAYRTAGARHGFAATFPATQGSHTVCVTSRNIGYGTDNTFGCRTVVLNDNPLGDLTVDQREGKLRVTGFVFDRDNPAAALPVTIRVDNGAPAVVTAAFAQSAGASKYGTSATHGFDQRYTAAEGQHTVCVTVANVGYGSDTSYGCRTITLNYTPTATVTSLVPGVEGLVVKGWATDPDTDAAIPLRVTLDGNPVRTVAANEPGTTQNGHNFTVAVPTASGTNRRVCAVAVNQVSGTHDSAPACETVKDLKVSPAGSFDRLERVGDNVRVVGWGYDADTTAPVTAEITVDGGAPQLVTASEQRDDVAAAYPSAGASRGFAPVLTTSDWKHTVCVKLRNAGPGADTDLGCKLIIAVHPRVTSLPQNATATPGNMSVNVSWSAPADDGGAPPTAYRIVANPDSHVVDVPATQTSAVVTGLGRAKLYQISVYALNAAGYSQPANPPVVRTYSGPAAQTTPAPISTSRYMRNIRTCNTAEATEMRNFGRADARRNPAGHNYLQLLDIGGQTARYGGVMLSAIVRFVSYDNLLRCSKAYVDGYASGMNATAPTVIAMGVNNDLDVTAATGRDWAGKIVNPLSAYARQYNGISIAGANDIEPGFSASYGATRNWLTGYLGATTAPFVFNGSADGCAYTTTGRKCNNGWTMAGLYTLAGGMAPTRTVNLPQVYNYTMADQWKFISLTGVAARQPRLNFGGPLTEAVACAQARSCKSINGKLAWQRMWNNLQSHPALRVGSLPYATDLRIDS